MLFLRLVYATATCALFAALAYGAIAVATETRTQLQIILVTFFILSVVNIIGVIRE